jgi:hypothetical protein
VLCKAFSPGESLKKKLPQAVEAASSARTSSFACSDLTPAALVSLRS